MKVLNIIRYVLFGVSLLGLFANFAQNEYGLSMIWYSDLIIALIFWSEAVIYSYRTFKISKLYSLYLFSEHFFAGGLFMAFYFKFMHWPGAGPLFVFCSGFLFILYFIYLIRFAIREPRKGKLISAIISFFIVGTIASVLGVVFKNMHWPGASILLYFSGISALLFIAMMLIKKNFSYENHLISFRERLRKIPGKMVLIFCYFGFWGIYVLMVSAKIVPGFYSISRPPALDKMWQDKPERAEIYGENYQNFLYNREMAMEK